MSARLPCVQHPASYSWEAEGVSLRLECVAVHWRQESEGSAVSGCLFLLAFKGGWLSLLRCVWTLLRLDRQGNVSTTAASTLLAPI